MSHHVVFIHNQEEARRCLEAIGSSPAGIDYMVPKAVFRCIKVKDISSRAANLLKQEMLGKGGEAAVSKNTALGEGNSDVLLMGTLKHYRYLNEKLRLQPFGLSKIAAEIDTILAALEPGETILDLANGKKLTIGKRTLIMGILNVTPDSFSDGGRYFDPGRAVQHALDMKRDGADIIDLGGASSRPDSEMASTEEELERILPVIKRLAQEDVIISVDTFRAEVARQALDQGAHLINDISGLQMDPDLSKVLAKWQAPVILMHNCYQLNSGQNYTDSIVQGQFIINPDGLNSGEKYTDLIADILDGLGSSIDKAVQAGLAEEKIIIDPGVGFGKTPAQNRLIIKQLRSFKSLGYPVLLGTSRKSFIGNTLDLDVNERLEGSLATVAIGIMNGADIVRVHDVKASKRVALMTDAVRNENG